MKGSSVLKTNIKKSYLSAVQGNVNVINEPAAPEGEGQVQEEGQDRNLDQNSVRQPFRRNQLPKAWLLSVQVSIMLLQQNLFSKATNFFNRKWS